MEFGSLPNVDRVDWTLPAEDPLTASYLAGLGVEKPAQFFVGTPAWGHREWVGKIYPPRTKSSDYLFHYSRSFNTIELNTTHYRIPAELQVQKWVAQVPDGFLFCPKIFQEISHSRRGLMDPSLMAAWLESLEFFGEHLGPCFLQLPPKFDYSDRAALFHFLQNWPDEFPLALEFRHPSWFENGRILPALTKYLQNRGIGLVITDVAGRRDVLHSSVSAPFTILRFIGNDLHPSDFPRATAWVARLRLWQELGLQRAFYFVHEPDDLNAPEMAQHVIHELNRGCDARLSEMHWVSSPPVQAELGI